MLLFFFYYTAIGQTIIKGRVIDEISREPLVNAVVTAGKTAITDEQGNFELWIHGGIDSIRVSFVGYHPRVFGVAVPGSGAGVVGSGGGKPMLIELSPGGVDLRAITIVPLPNNASFSTISSIDLNMHALNSAQDLMRLVPGLSLMQHQGGGYRGSYFLPGFLTLTTGQTSMFRWMRCRLTLSRIRMGRVLVICIL